MPVARVKKLSGMYKDCTLVRIDYCHYCKDGNEHMYGGYVGCWGFYDETNKECCEDCGQFCVTCKNFFHVDDPDGPQDSLFCVDCSEPDTRTCYKCFVFYTPEDPVEDGGYCEKCQAEEYVKESSETKEETCPPTTSCTENTA